jgi:hypothetical protein
LCRLMSHRHRADEDKYLKSGWEIEMNGGDDGARTRDLRRDRPAF